MTDVTAPTEESRLENLLSEPTPGVVETMRRLDGDMMVLGVSGKMGPSLARMAKRASDAAGVRRKVIGVARFSAGGEESLRAHDIDPIRCDLLDEAAVGRLPDVANVVFMPARKFGSTGDEATTWAVNSYLPGIVARKFRDSRIVAFSTGNVYALTPANNQGPCENDPPAPVGEYAMSCLGRERVFEYFSRSFRTRVAIIRLNYATDLRYGVLVDLARQVFAGEPIDLTMGHFNTIWQGDANAMALRAFERAASPPWILNVTGPEVLSVREVCERFGRRMGRSVRFTGSEAETALLNNARRGLELFGPLRMSTDRLIDWVADWVSCGGRCLGKPTHFQARDGRF
jgi:nucleoside-diphosphate-sugar epimerase